MRWRGVHHIELSVLDYERSIAFYDRMFGWLGYQSFWTLDVGYRSTYYMTRLPIPHSYIGIQPARTGGPHVHGARPVGLHHLALWARGRREIDRFHTEFLLKNEVTVTEAPARYDHYAPGYYAVFFDDPVNGFHWELVYTPRLPSPRDLWAFWRALKRELKARPELGKDPLKQAMRPLPGRKEQARGD